MRSRSKLPLHLDDAGDVHLTDGDLALPGARLAVALDSGPRLGVRLDAAPFATRQLVPWLATWDGPAPEGRLGFDGLAVRLDPLSVEGAIDLDGVGLPLEAGHLGVVTGRVEGEGDALVGDGLRVEVAGQPVALSLRVTGLAAGPRARIQLQGDGVESAALLAALGGPAETLSGPLRLDAELRAPLGGGGELTDALRGRIAFAIAPGRLKGVSLLRSTFDRLGEFGELAFLAGAAFGGSSMQRFYGDEFEELSGSFDVADGIATTRDLKIRYRHYQADLRGRVRLGDQSLDMTGDLTLDAEVDEVVAAGSGNAQVAPEPRVIPLARVTGTVSDPEVKVTRRVAVGLARVYLADRGKLGEVERKIDERLGEGAGKQVIDTLESLFGGGRREE